jgi:hypothetical protein
LQIDLKALRRHYSSLSDDELLALNRDELIETAQKCYDEELERRGLNQAQESEVPSNEHEYMETSEEIGVHPDWLEDGACVCAFGSQPGGSAASDADHAYRTLQDAGVPCEVSVVEVAAATGDQPAQHEYRVMVPAALNLKATSILDIQVFNPQLEADWRTHFASLTDSELGALKPDVICAGLVDRIARLKKVYNDEISRRFRRLSG